MLGVQWHEHFYAWNYNKMMNCNYCKLNGPALYQYCIDNMSILLKTMTRMTSTWDLQSQLSQLVEQYQRVRTKLREQRSKANDTILHQARTFYRKLQQNPSGKRFITYVEEEVEGSQLCFTVVFLLLMLIQYIAVTNPSQFYVFYICLYIPLYIWRIFDYKSKKWQYFLYDWCYFSHGINYISLLMYPDSAIFTTLSFMCANGPVAWAIIVWRNSLVFHNYEKSTSFLVHFLPVVVTFCHRWYGYNGPELDFSLTNTFLIPLMTYLLWQLLFAIHVDWLSWHRIQHDPEMQTSCKWFFTKDKDTAIVKSALKLCRFHGLFGPEEEFSADEWRSRFVFYMYQFIYTTVSLVPTAFLLYSKVAHTIFLLFVLIAGCNNGATYYLSNSYARGRLEYLAHKKELKELSKAEAIRLSNYPHCLPANHEKMYSSTDLDTVSDISQTDNELDDASTKRMLQNVSEAVNCQIASTDTAAIASDKKMRPRKELD
jgi:hypothetical protein